MENKHKILVSGLGGGLDVINASLLYHVLRSAKRCCFPELQPKLTTIRHSVMLGSVRHIELNSIELCQPFAGQIGLVSSRRAQLLQSPELS